MGSALAHNKEEVSVRKTYFRFRRYNSRKYHLKDASCEHTGEFSRWLAACEDGVMVRVDLRRIKQSSAEIKLKGLRSDRASELKIHRNQDSFASRMRRELADIDNMTGLSSNGSGIFDVVLTVKLSSDHPADISKKSMRFERAMELLGLRFNPEKYYSKRGLQPRILESNGREKYLMDSNSLAGLLPVFLPTKNNSDGVYIGTESSTGIPLFFNQFENSSYNINIIGETGSGKSFFSKILAMRSLSDGVIDWLIVIDPLNEYEPTFAGMSSCVVDLSMGEYLDHSNLIGNERQKEELIKFICDLAELTEEQSAAVKSASENMEIDNDRIALLDKLIEFVKDKDLVSRLKELKSRHFRKRKQLDPDRDKVLIIKTPADLGSERGKLLLMATVTARTLCSVLPGKKMVLVDEMHLFLSERGNSQFVSNFFRNSRHYETSIVGMTQNLYDLEASEFAETIRDNSIALLIFRTRSVVSNNRFVDLDDFGNPALELLVGGKKHDYSECYMLYRQRLKKLRIIATEEELALIDRPVP